MLCLSGALCHPLHAVLHIAGGDIHLFQLHLLQHSGEPQIHRAAELREPAAAGRYFPDRREEHLPDRCDHGALGIYGVVPIRLAHQ